MNQKNKPSKIFDLIIAVFIGFLLIGNIFRIQHWPFGREITFVSMVSLGMINLFSFIRHYLKPKRKYLDSIGLLIILLIISIQLNKLILFTEMTGLIRPLLLLSVIWVAMNVLSAIRKKTYFQMTTGEVLVIIGLSCLIGESILRSNHLPLGSVFSFAGLLITMIGLFINYQIRKS